MPGLSLKSLNGTINMVQLLVGTDDPFDISAVYLNRFLTHQLKYQPHDALALTLLGSALMLALMPIIAMIADMG